jgi:hypothetical protein
MIRELSQAAQNIGKFDMLELRLQYLVSLSSQAPNSSRLEEPGFYTRYNVRNMEGIKLSFGFQ